MKRVVFFLLAWLISSYGFAKVTLPSVLSSNMVLQRETNVPFWGKALPGSKVQITTSWNKKKYVAQADNRGAWRALIETPSAGGPFEIIFDDGEKLALKNILIGEVWVCSGQSNMEMPVKGFRNQPILNAGDILMGADNPQLRLFRYELALSTTPQFDAKSTGWEAANAKTANEFSAVGFQFAQILQQKLKVPVGIIMTSWGGTRIEAWMSANSLAAFPENKIPAVADSQKIKKNDPSVLFNAMIHPFLGFGIKGFLWYQGEANRNNVAIYDQLMATMVRDWRTLWGRGDFPFYYVQIAPFRYNDKVERASFLREAQLKANGKIPNSGMVVTMDIGAADFIHPPDKTTISKRLACLALANTYGFDGLPNGSPVYKSMKVDGNVATLAFDHAVNGLTSFGKPLSLFEVAGEDKVFYPATAKFIVGGIAVQSEQVKTPVAVRYAFKEWVVGDLFNTEGLPASSFRTDNW